MDISLRKAGNELATNTGSLTSKTSLDFILIENFFNICLDYLSLPGVIKDKMIKATGPLGEALKRTAGIFDEVGSCQMLF